MTVSNSAYLESFHDAAKAAGAKDINSDFAFEIEGFEGAWILAKSCPWPVLTSGEPIEFAGPLGSNAGQPSQVKTFREGEVEFYETVAGTIDQLLINLIASGGKFNAKIYRGDPTNYVEAKLIKDCFISVQSDPARDWENRTQPLLINGTLYYHYFGEILQGNITAL